MKPSQADLDRRKARIVACLYPTRIKRGFKTTADCKRLGAMLGISGGTLTTWENGDVLVPDERLPEIERWFSSGPVYRYDRIDHVVGPEAWPEPLDMARETAPQSSVAVSKQAINVGLGADPVSEVGVGSLR